MGAHGVRVELPRGWSGRLSRGGGGTATLHAANYALALNDGEFGDRSTATMPAGGTFLSLTEYQPGGDLRPGTGLYRAKALDLPLDPAALSPRGLAHARPNQAGLQQFATLSGRPFCLYVVAAGDAPRRRRGLLHADQLLRTLHVSPR
jgi:hypothetical protein